MRWFDAGKGYGKLIISVLVLGVIGFCAAKVVPVYVANYEMQDYIRALAVQMSAKPSPADVILNDVLSKAEDLGLPITKENVKVRITSRVTIDVDYQVPVDLKVYIWVLHFAPSSENVL
jgi:YbbR domain-containing protein